jgi:hypothetical protein
MGQANPIEKEEIIDEKKNYQNLRLSDSNKKILFLYLI